MKSTHWVMKRWKSFLFIGIFEFLLLWQKNCSKMSLFTPWQMYKSRSDNNVHSLCVRLCFWYQNGTQWIPADWIFRKSLVSKESYKLCFFYVFFIYVKQTMRSATSDSTKPKQTREPNWDWTTAKKIHFVYTWKMVCLF